MRDLDDISEEQDLCEGDVILTLEYSRRPDPVLGEREFYYYTIIAYILNYNMETRVFRN